MGLRYRPDQARRRRADLSEKVLQWARAFVGDETVGVSISVNACGHAACAGEETVILLMRPGQQTIGLRLAKSLETVTQADIAEVLQPVLSSAS